MPPAAPGGPVTRIGLDASQADNEIGKLLKKISLLTGGMKALAVATLNYNERGKVTDGVIRGLTDAGTQMDVFVKKVKGGWEVVGQVTRQSIDRMIRDEARLAAEKKKQAQEAKNFANTMTFRQKLAAEGRRQIPTAATQVEQRFFVNAQRDLEKFVASGAVTAKRAETILDNIRAGVKGRLKDAEEDFRVAALRMFNAAQNVKTKFDQAAAKKAAALDSQKVAGVLGSSFGPLNPTGNPAIASTAAVGRVDNLFNRLAASVESASVPFTRFQDLVTKTMAGVADPTNKAERNIVRLVKSIQAEYGKATDAALKLSAAMTRVQGASTFRTGLEKRLAPGLGGLDEVDHERVQAQVARIQNLMARQNNPLSAAGATAAVDAGLKGKTGGFSGVEEQARKSAARIRQVISGQLKDPFGIKLAIDNNIGTIRGLYTARIISQLVQDFDAVVTKAAEFQRSIALIQTITTAADGSFNQWSNSIRKVSDELGKPIAEIAAAGYDVLSNQVTKNVEDTTRVLRTAGQFARITNSSTEDSINLLSSAINTFKLQSGDAERVASQFFTTIDLGRVKTQEMANTIGRSAVYAKTLGVSLEELQAGIITITQTGQKADSSFTLLNNVFQKLLNPTKELQELYDRLGVGTGEIFVKTYGFTGALKVLAKESEGSKAKLADFFNEIRAFGGIDALISRSAIFEGALKSLGDEAQENADKAKRAFDNLPGQRFLEEMNKVKNLFLTTFQTGLLKSILDNSVTHAFGGLANTIKLATAASVGLGVALGETFLISKVAAYISKLYEVEAALGALTGMTAKAAIINKLLWGAGVLAIVAVGVVLGKLYQDMVDYYDTVIEKAEEAAEKQIAANARVQSKVRKEYEATLKLEQKRTLDILGIQVQAGQERVKVAEATNKLIQESTKNAFENAYGSARASLDELKSRQRDALKDAQDFRKTGRARITNERDENLFRVRLTRNDTLNQNNPNALVKNERALYRNRLKQLNTLIQGAANRGDMETAKKFLDQKDSILNEMANKTVQIRGRTYMRYNGADQQLIKNSEYRLKVEEKIAKLRETEALTLQATINTETDKISALEDAYKDVYAFKLEDNGKPIDENEDAALKRYDAAVAKAKRLTREVQESAGRRDPTMSRDLFRRQSDLSFGRGADLRAGIVQRFRETSSLSAIRKAQQEDILRLGDEAKERFDEASRKAEEASGEYSKAFHKSVAVFKNLGRQSILPDDPSLFYRRADPSSLFDRATRRPQSLKRAELENNVNAALQAGNFDGALKELDKLIKFYKEAKVLKRQLLGEGGQRFTLAKLLGDTRQSILDARAKGRTAYVTEKVAKAAEAQTPQNNNLLNELEKSLQALGPTSKDIIAKLIADQSAYQTSIAQTLAGLRQIVQQRNAVGPSVAESAENDALHKAGKPTPYILEDGTLVGKGINPLEKADGGYIHPGGPKGTDTIPAWLTPGEYVMPAAMTDKYRPLLERMRAGYFSMGGDAYCATGGQLQIGGQHPVDALTGGIYGSTKKLLEKHRQKIAAARISMGRHSKFMGDGEDFEPLGFAQGGVVDNFTAQLKALNSGFSSGSYGAGEGNTSVGDINITVQGGDSGKATVQEMGRELDRALRRKAINLRGR